MPSESYRRVKDLYLRVVALSPEERDLVLEAECAGDPALKADVMSLLGYEEDPRSPGEVAAELLETAGERASVPMPETIGGYRILRVIGEGGMGVVYEAQQETPRRRVALKVLRGHLVSQTARRRFELEAEMLGRLRHRGIAQIFEASTDAETGTPFILMEFIDGQPLSHHLQAGRPSDRERLELWTRICDAVQHAHGQGVVHRDLKPGNILVTADGEPKVLDFGVARVLDDEARSATLRTHVGEVVGTVGYMSPEQASGDPDLIDTRTDVYALGVVGYEMMTGALPHDLGGRPLHEAMATIREAAPVAPRARRPDLPIDVETILLKALELEKDRRYPTADALRADVRRFLDDEPIAAHPPSTWYQVRLFARRNRALVFGSLAVFVALIAGLVSTMIYAGIAHDAAERERDARGRAEGLAARERAANARATELARRERRERELAERATYSSQIAAASAAVEAGRTVEARRLLAATQATRRGWEWHHLAARLDPCEVLLGEDAPVAAGAAFLAEPRELVTVTRGGALRTYSLPSLRPAREIPLAPGVTAFSIARDGRTLATAHGDGSLVLWDGDGREVHRSAAGTVAKPAAALALQPGGLRCLVRSDDRTFLWSPGDGSYVRLPGTTSVARWSPDGERIVSARDRIETVSDALRRGGRSRPEGDRRLRSEEIVTAAAFDASGERVAFGTVNPSMQIVDAASGERLHYHRARRVALRSITWSPDGRHLVTGDDAGEVHLWSAATGTLDRHLPGHEAPVTLVIVDPSGRFVAGVAGGRLRVWDLRRHPDGVETTAAPVAVTAVAYSPDGTLLATAFTGGVSLWDPDGGACVRVLREPVKPSVRGLAWSGDGRRVHASGWGLTAFDAATGERLEELSGREHAAYGRAAADVSWPGRLKFGRGTSPDGALMLLAGRTPKAPVSVVRTADGGEAASLRLGTTAFGASFSRDGRGLALALGDGTVSVRESGEWKESARLEGHAGAVHAVAFTPDGSRLVTAGQDGTIRFWDTTDWYETAVFHGHGGDVQALDFSPDGARLASGSHDRTFRVWTSVPRRHLRRPSVR